MSDENTVETSPGVTVTREPGKVPLRQDKRSLLEMLHQEIGEKLGIGHGDGAGKHVIDGQPKTVMEAVDGGIKDGTESD